MDDAEVELVEEDVEAELVIDDVEAEVVVLVEEVWLSVSDAVLVVVALVVTALVVVGVAVSSPVSADEGCPSGPMVSGGNPGGGGGIIPPATTSAAGTTMIPIPRPTYQIGSTVACPPIEVVVTELAVRLAIVAVVVENVPDSSAVCGPSVMGVLCETVALDADVATIEVAELVWSSVVLDAVLSEDDVEVMLCEPEALVPDVMVDGVVELL